MVASALIERDGRFLLVNAKVGMPKGLWNLPGGHLDDGETFSKAVLREAKEETGLDIEILHPLCIVHQNFQGRNTLIVSFSSRIIGGSVSPPAEEIEEARWFSFEEVEALGKSKITGSAYNSILAFKKNKQMNYSTDRITA